MQKSSCISGILKVFKIQLLCMSIKRSWNFVIRSWKSHGILSRQFRGNPDYSYVPYSFPDCINDLSSVW